MKPLTSRGSRLGWLYVFGLFLAVLGGFRPESARAQNYPKEYIRVQPVVSGPIREGDSTTIDLEYAQGQDALDLEPVFWYRNGVLVGVTTPVLQTYTTPAGPQPKLWDPYKGLTYPEEADPATATKNARNACARWVATFTASQPGMYRAKIGSTGNSNRWTYTNFAQVAMVPVDPSRALEIVRNPASKSVSAPYSDPQTSIQLFGDMRSHVLPLLNTPFGAATDAEGFTFVADTLNHSIRRVSPGGRVTTFAGIDGQPSSYVELSQNDLSVPKRDALTRKERDPAPDFIDGVINQSTKAADAGYRFQSSNSAAFLSEPKFRGPEAITVSDIGVVYVADTGNHAIRRIWTDNTVSPAVQKVETLFGGPMSPDLRSPRGIYFSGSSSDPANPPVLYVLNSADYSVKKLFLNEIDGSLDTSKGDVNPFFPTRKTGCENIAGLGMTPGWQGLPVSAVEARFYSPRGIVGTTYAGVETVYVADTVNHVIRQIRKVNGVWITSTLVGFVGAKGNVNTLDKSGKPVDKDGNPVVRTGNTVGTDARLNYPVGLAMDETKRLLYFTEFGNHSLRRIYLPGHRRLQPKVVVTDPETKVPDLSVDLVAGSGFYGPVLFGPNGPQGTGNGDGLGAEAVFYYPAGISFNKWDNSIMLTDSNNHCLRKVSVSMTGDNAWLGRSAALAGAVGISGNRSFEEMEEFSYHWKKDAVLMTDRAVPDVGFSAITGSETDTLNVTNLQYEDAGTYGLVVTNTFDEKVEMAQSFVYVATAGDSPRFLAPGYRVESPYAPGVPLAEFRQGMDVLIFADILPSDQVTYQWEVAEDKPDLNGDYVWVAISDLPIEQQSTRIGELLGNSLTTSISGSTTSKLSIEKLQVYPQSSGVPPKLRFRVQCETKASPALPMDTKMSTVTLNATWTVGPQKTVTVDSGDGIYEGMFLVGKGIAPDSIIKAINRSNPSAVVLTLDKPVLESGTQVQISAAEDLSAGIGVSVRHSVFIIDPRLSYGNPATQLELDRDPVKVEVKAPITLALSAGSSAASGNPIPTYQWYKRSSVAGTPIAIKDATDTKILIPEAQLADRGYYFVRISNTVDGNLSYVDSNAAFVDVAGETRLSIIDVNLDGGTVTQNFSTQQKRVVDKTKSEALTLIANVDASETPNYTWEFVRAIDGAIFSGTALASLGASQITRRTSGELYFAKIPDDADGVFNLRIKVGTGASAKNASCSWHVTVKYLPKYRSETKVFNVGGVNASGEDAYTVNLSEGSPLLLSAEFLSPPSLPLTYRWRKDGVLVGGTSNSLRIDRLTLRDMGTYRLEVTNALGTLVFGPTTKSETPFPGTPPPAGWTLKASGRPSVTVQPTGKALLSTNTNLSPALAGTVGAASRAPSLLAASAPATAVQRVARGQRIALQVAVDADPAPTYQWYRKRSGEAFFSTVTGATSAIYVLPTATELPGTKSRYYVVAKNILDEVSSEEIEVQVEGLPDPRVSPSLLGNPAWQGGSAPSGSTVVLDAVVTDLQAPYTYQWKVNGNPIFGAVSKQLRLASIQSTQAGAYSVVATGVAGTKESERYTLNVAAAVGGARYSVLIEDTDQLKSLAVFPPITAVGFTAGTKVSLIGLPQTAKMLQGWRASYINTEGQIVESTLAARAGQFVMPAADVTITPVVSRSYAGSYTGLLSLEAPWDTADAMEWGTEASLFRASSNVAASNKVRGLFTCTVSNLGAVSGQIQLENKAYSFTSVLDSEMRGTFRIATTLKGIAWSMNGTLAFNPTEENRQQGYVDNVLHVVLKDALLVTPPLVQVGQTLYCAAAGYSGATDALRADVTEVLLAESMVAAAPAPEAAPANPVQGAAAAVAPLEIVLNPVDVLTTIGGFATFTVVIRGGTAPYTYEWTRDGAVVKDFQTPATSHTLALYNVQTKDVGRYRVVVRDKTGNSVTSTSAFLKLPSIDDIGGGGSGIGPTLAPPMTFTSAVYRDSKENSFGQAAVLSAQVRFGTGTTVVQGYLANGTRITFSTSLNMPYVTQPLEAPDAFELQPVFPSAQPFIPTAGELASQASEALSEALLRRSSSQSIVLWLRGDVATEPVFGAMIFNGPRVYGSLGVLNADSSKKSCIYTPNALAGSYYDPTVPHLANVPAGQLVTNQSSVTMTTPGAYIDGLSVSWPTGGVAPTLDKVFATVDSTTGLLFGGMLETTTRYVQTSPPSSPLFASYKSILACSTAGVLIQKRDILPGLTWTPSNLGGYVGFIYRGKNFALEPLKNVLGTGAPEVINLKGKVTERVEPFRINVTEQF